MLVLSKEGSVDKISSGEMHLKSDLNHDCKKVIMFSIGLKGSV